MNREQTEKLDWDAFRYITDEMTSVEVEAFEKQLSTDQASREAVADAVELVQAMASSSEHDKVSVATRERSHSRVSRLAWMTLGAVACLALMSVAQGWLNHGSDGGNQPQLPSVASGELAQLWSEARDDSPEDEWRSEWLAEEEESFPVGSYDESEDGSSAPSWMLAAVSSQPSELDAIELDAPSSGVERIE